MRAAASMWRLLLPTEIRSSGDGSSLNGGIANARKWRGGNGRRPVLMFASPIQMLGNQCLRKSQNIWLALIENRPPSALKHHLLERRKIEMQNGDEFLSQAENLRWLFSDLLLQ